MQYGNIYIIAPTLGFNAKKDGTMATTHCEGEPRGFQFSPVPLLADSALPHLPLASVTFICLAYAAQNVAAGNDEPALVSAARARF